MSEIKTGGPAFPLEDGVHRGMTLRDYFAAKAMQALIDYEEGTIQKDAEIAYAYADAMLKTRETK